MLDSQGPMSTISFAAPLQFDELSDSNSTTHHRILLNNKRPRNPNSAPASKFKGVVPQQNGHWGCQIYANHQRIWLGTFKSEQDAAMAYDSAALKLRASDHTRRNFPLNPVTAHEPTFQLHYTTDAVLTMIKDGTYPSKFAEFVSIPTELSLEAPLRGGAENRAGGIVCRRLFEKELTPSDVSKLNRLVVPKKYAELYFPKVPEEAVREEDEVVMSFYDARMERQWRFRYCYWKSSQSYVFTRGWNKFVRENRLEAKDTVAFCLCERRDGCGSERFFVIELSRHQPQTEEESRGIMLFGVRIV